MRKYFLFLSLILCSFSSIFSMKEKSFYPGLVKDKRVYYIVKHEDNSFSSRVERSTRKVRSKIKLIRKRAWGGRIFYSAYEGENYELGFTKISGNVYIARLTIERGLEVVLPKKGEKRFSMREDAVRFSDEERGGSSVCKSIILPGFCLLGLAAIGLFYAVS